MAENSATLSANGSSGWLRLAQGLNILYLNSDSWSTSAVAVSLALDSDGTGAESVFDGASEYSGTASTKKQLNLWGDGTSCIRLTMSNYGGTPVTGTVRTAIPIASPVGI